MRDYYIDDRTQEFLRGDDSAETFQEFWVFQRMGNNWLLREINQTRESDALRAENFVEELTPEQLKNIYGTLATAAGGEKAPWLEEAIGIKAGKIERMLNFLSSTDKSWDQDFMKEKARKIFAGVLTGVEKLDLSSISSELLPGAIEKYSKEIEEMKVLKRTVEYRNLCVRKVDIVLVKNFNDNGKDEFTTRISAHAQIIETENGRVIRKDEYVSPFEEYWTFQKQAGQWKLKEVQEAFSAKTIVQMENIDEESGKEQLQWYYTQERAV